VSTVASATLFAAIFPVVGLLAAIFILREVYGYIEVQPAPSASRYRSPPR
jgi:hypothetical protein